MENVKSLWDGLYATVIGVVITVAAGYWTTRRSDRDRRHQAQERERQEQIRRNEEVEAQERKTLFDTLLRDNDNLRHEVAALRQQVQNRDETINNLYSQITALRIKVQEANDEIWQLKRTVRELETQVHNGLHNPPE